MKQKRKKVPAIHVLHALELAALHGQQWRGRVFIPAWVRALSSQGHE